MVLDFKDSKIKTKGILYLFKLALVHRPFTNNHGVHSKGIPRGQLFSSHEYRTHGANGFGKSYKAFPLSILLDIHGN